MSAVVGLDQARAELEAVIASGIFSKAPSLALLLDYICNKYFEGKAGQIKEYNIAVEALGRASSFDPRQDSIVRVEAFRLRKRLKQYYLEEGADSRLRIVIPSGQYVPQFVEYMPAAPEPEAGGSGNALPPTVPVIPAVACDDVVQPAAASSPWTRMALLAGSLVVASALAIVIWGARSHSALKAASVPAAAPIGTESEEIRILAGSSAARYVDRGGSIWSGDRFVHGGSIVSTPKQIIVGTPDPELFRSRREGNFTYDIPLKPGVYELHLYFAETLFGENSAAGGGEASRVFRVSINGKPALWSFDVISDAGSGSTADEKVFKDISPAADGMLRVQFAGLANNVPFLNALEIVPGIPGKMRPVRIVSRGRNYTDQLGRLWGADRYYSHGNVVVRSEPVSNTSDPEIFKTERFGNFIYTIPVAEGRYSVTMKFAETWFGPGRPGAGGDESRLFDVYSNGVALLRGFDIFRAAGGAKRAMEKTFHGIVPNAQGKIVLSFVPTVNYACVNAIEIVDESEAFQAADK